MTNSALSPAYVNQDIIDYGSPSGMKLYSQETASLSDKFYDLTPEGLHSFLSKIRSKTIKMGWNNILQIPTGLLHEEIPESRNLLDHYGEESMEQIDLHVISYEIER